MEQAAMKDYRSKDLLGGADISARIFNEKKSERDKEKKAIEEAAAKAREKIEQENEAGMRYQICLLHLFGCVKQ
jgi:hypothetical protein